MNQKTWAVTIPFISILIISLTLSPVLGSSSVNIFPPGSKPYGLSYVDHIKNFWKWLESIPKEESPTNDPTGAKCTTGQSNTNSTVFYLAHQEGKYERTCKVPAGKGLFIPVMEVVVSDKEIPNASVEELARAAETNQNSTTSLYLKIDDKEYKYEELIEYRTHTDPFEVVIADNGIYGVTEGGTSKAVADGFYVITEPLTKGNHTVHFKSTLPGYVQDLNYNIIVE